MKKILVIEDETDIREILTAFLEDAGYQVVSASDGVEGISKFHEEQNLDLVVLDIMLPKIDGYGVCEVIRQNSQLPVIMLTALDGEEDQLRGYNLKIDDYITKPFSMQILMKKIEAVIRRTTKTSEDRRLCYRKLTIDPDGYKTWIKSEVR